MNVNAVRTGWVWPAFVLGLLTLLWVGYGFIGNSWVALGVTALMLAAYVLAAWELRGFVQHTQGLAQAVQQAQAGVTVLDDWLSGVPSAMQVAVRQRVQGGRGVMPGLALTPYVIGLLVMLGMLGTFLGMVVTFKGAVFALEGSADLQAIRAALAAPIKGLGLAFGTSVAGVASSAMLGWMAASLKRQRLQVLRALDAQIATTLFPFTTAHQRQVSFEATQAQAQALPEVVTQLQQLIARIDSRAQELDTQLLARQSTFHQEAAAAYTGLGESVARSLQDAISTSTRVATETLQPIVTSAMDRVAQESQRWHAQAGEAVQQQLIGVSARFDEATTRVTDGWAQALQAQGQTNSQLVNDLQHSLGRVSAQLDERGAHLLSQLNGALSEAQRQQEQAQTQQRGAWTELTTSQHAHSARVLSELGDALTRFTAEQAAQGERSLAQWRATLTEAQTQQAQFQTQQREAWAQVAESQHTRGAQTLQDLADALQRFSAEQAEQGARWMGQLQAAWREQQSAQAQADQTQQAAWQDAQQQQSQSHAQLVADLAEALTHFNSSFEARAVSSQDALSQRLSAMQSARAEADQAQQAVWVQAMADMSEQLRNQWQQVSAEHLTQQQAAAQALTQAAQALQASASAQASSVQQDIQQLLDSSHSLVAAREQQEALWQQQQSERMDALAALWRSELGALREREQAHAEGTAQRWQALQTELQAQWQSTHTREDQRSEAAVARLDNLQTSMATQLSALGQALEAPMTRLLATASDAPKAAAEVIAQLRHDMSQLSERDNQALQERAELMQQMSDLVQGVQQATGEQRDAMEALVQSTSSVLQQVSAQFSDALGAQVSHTDGLAAQVAGSAAELAALGEAFHQGVQLFSGSNAALVERLGQIEAAIQQSLARSDEQVAYYVAQAREVIDLSISAQQGIVEDLRRLRSNATTGAA